MKIFVAGSWHKNKIKKVEKDIEKVGRLLAENKHILVIGGGSGVSEIVARSYLKFGGRKCIVYDVAPRFRKKAGEKRKVKGHQLIKTGEDYPVRNNIMIRNCDLTIAFNGGLGVLGEILSAVNDYHESIIIFEKKFNNISCIKKILNGVGKSKIFYVDNVNEIKKIINEKSKNKN